MTLVFSYKDKKHQLFGETFQSVEEAMRVRDYIVRASKLPNPKLNFPNEDVTLDDTLRSRADVAELVDRVTEWYASLKGPGKEARNVICEGGNWYIQFKARKVQLKSAHAERGVAVMIRDYIKARLKDVHSIDLNGRELQLQRNQSAQETPTKVRENFEGYFRKVSKFLQGERAKKARPLKERADRTYVQPIKGKGNRLFEAVAHCVEKSDREKEVVKDHMRIGANLLWDSLKDDIIRAHRAHGVTSYDKYIEFLQAVDSEAETIDLEIVGQAYGAAFEVRSTISSGVGQKYNEGGTLKYVLQFNSSTNTYAVVLTSSGEKLWDPQVWGTIPDLSDSDSDEDEADIYGEGQVDLDELGDEEGPDGGNTSLESCKAKFSAVVNQG